MGEPYGKLKFVKLHHEVAMSILDEMLSIVLASRLCLHDGPLRYLVLPTP